MSGSIYPRIGRRIRFRVSPKTDLTIDLKVDPRINVKFELGIVLKVNQRIV
jgi:hypothetical protein